jgi:hypothetical protein
VELDIPASLPKRAQRKLLWVYRNDGICGTFAASHTVIAQILPSNLSTVSSQLHGVLQLRAIWVQELAIHGKHFSFHLSNVPLSLESRNTSYQHLE